MANLEKEFLEYIAEQIFLGNARSEFQYSIFVERFNPNNYPLKITDIAKGLNKMNIPKNYSSGVNQHLKEVIIKIFNNFKNELIANGITENHIGLGKNKGKKGRIKSSEKSPWQIVYDWLWEKKYFLWSQDYIWKIWKEKAKNNRHHEWIQFSEINSEETPKAIKIPQGRKETLPMDTPLKIKIDLDYPGGYLLLLNVAQNKQGEISRYLLTPSQAFAPSYQLIENSISIPQQDAMSPEIKFEAEGKEEFVGIVIDDALDLPWLDTDKENPILEWQGEHLIDLWQKWSNKHNWHILYRNFEVMPKN